MILNQRASDSPWGEAPRTPRRRHRPGGWWSSLPGSASGGSLWPAHLATKTKKRIMTGPLSLFMVLFQAKEDTQTHAYLSSIWNSRTNLKCLIELLAAWRLRVSPLFKSPFEKNRLKMGKGGWNRDESEVYWRSVKHKMKSPPDLPLPEQTGDSCTASLNMPEYPCVNH